MSILKNGLFIGAVAVLGLGVVGWVSTDYWWNTRIKPLPEYQLVTVMEAFGRCDMPALKESLALHEVLYGIGEQQVQLELKHHTALTKKLVNSKLVAPFIHKKIESAIATIEKGVAGCANKTSDIAWLLPAMQSFVVFKNFFEIITIEHSQVATDGQSASFIVQFSTNNPKPRELQATVHLKKQPANAAHPWRIVRVELNDETLALLNEMNQPTKKKK